MTRPAWLGQQSHDPRLFPGSLCGVKGGTREGKHRGRVGDRRAINPYPSQELIFDLHQIPWVKEGRSTRKERVSHLIGMWMKRVRLAQAFRLTERTPEKEYSVVLVCLFSRDMSREKDA